MPSLALVLELHHPLPAPGRGAGADWARSAAELYWPLLRVLDDFATKAGEASITLAVSPSWSALAADPAARRLVRRELREGAGRREGDRPLLRFFAEAGGDALGLIRRWNDAGTIDAIPTAATHAWLPAVAADPGIAAAQIGLAVADHAARLNARPSGIWLPFLAYAPGLEDAMAAAGARFFGVSADAFLRGTILPPAGTLAPMVTPPGVAVHAVSPPPGPAVDPRAGYGLDPRYADPKQAPRAATEHARHFLDRWIREASAPPPNGDPPADPIATTALSVQDLARTWPAGGGVAWLARLLELLAGEHSIRASSLDRHLARNPVGVLGRPAVAAGGPLAARPAGSDLHDRCRASADLLAFALDRRASLAPPQREALADMIRLLLRAQQIDWSLPAFGAIEPEEGLRRASALLARFHRRAADLMAGRSSPPRRDPGPAFLPHLDLDDAAID